MLYGVREVFTHFTRSESCGNSGGFHIVSQQMEIYMKRITLSGLMALLVSLLSSSMIFGAGFQIPEQGVASMGMGMAGIGKADDLAAIYHNPAGLAAQKGTNLYVDVAGIGP